MIIISFLVFALSFINESQAGDLSPTIGLGIEFGGDSLIDTVYSDGTKSNIAAGRGLLLNGGVVYSIWSAESKSLDLQGTIGVKWTSVKQATNGNVDWIRWPIDCLIFYHDLENTFRLGAGFTYQIGNRLKGTGYAAPASATYRNSLGPIFQGDYFVGEEKNISLGLRVTIIKYTISGSNSAAKGNSIGAWGGYFW